MARRPVMVFAGSFNPPHKGHMETARTLASCCDTLYLVIGVNPNKKYDVSAEDRKKLLEAIVAEAGFKNVEIVTTTDYIWRFCKQVGATELFRSVRTWKQDGGAERFLELQNLYGPWLFLNKSMPTTFIEGNPQYSHVSSTFIRDCVAKGDKSMDDFVYCADEIRKVYGPNSSEDTKET